MSSFEVRKGYESERLLIEFQAIPTGKFEPLWDTVLLSLKAVLVSTEDVWENDEHIRRYISPIGKFILAISNWELPFIMADDFEIENDDNSVVLAFAEALVKSGQFAEISTSEK
ncbi:hypothetical protein [Parasphingorhabdus sp.]|uniref:hypothetical protein n=1 Tax=Parasphingorhabdus sp. TaxID=2709688 RepID=UPI00359316C1